MVDNARSFIYIAVMNYLPTMEFSHPRRYAGKGQGPGRGAPGRGGGSEGKQEPQAGEQIQEKVQRQGSYPLTELLCKILKVPGSSP